VETVVREPIAARNLVFGVSNFFVLPVPVPWELVRGPFPPEVDVWTRRGNVSWVTEGRAAYLLHDRGTKRGVELHIDVRRHAPPGPWRAAGRNSAVIGGHRAGYSVGTLHRGLWPRRRLHRLEAGFVCEPLSRVVTLQLIAAYGQEVLLDLLRALGDVQCH
jgi:hypothetical protein